MENKPILIVDGDILNFTIGRATEDISDFDGQICKHFDKEEMIKMFEAGLEDIAQKCGYNVDEIVYSLSCEKNYRKRFFPTYKSNRKNVVKPLGLSWLREYQKENAVKYNILLMEELEADDCMGIAGTSGNHNVSIYSQDKDLRTIPVRQWDFKKNKFWTPSEHEANLWLYTQVLTGDVVDGYIGCPKIGKVKAEIALKDCRHELDMIEKTFVRYYVAYDNDAIKAKEEMLAQLGQARILHKTDYFMLVNEDMTFNPFMFMAITDEQLEGWGKDYVDHLSNEKVIKAKAIKDKAKQKREEKKRIKDV